MGIHSKFKAESEEVAPAASTSSGGRGSAGRTSGGIYTSIKSMTRPSTAASASSGRCSDYYSSLDKVVHAFAREGLRQSYLIIGVHFTKFNYGADDPYEKSISIIEKTLAPFDADSLYPCFGFGDEAGKVFSFHSDHSPCEGIEEVLACYNKIVPNVTRLSGPTSYAPVIEAAVNIVEKRGGQFHTLVIVADNQVTSSFFNPRNGKLSPEGTETIKSIANASSYPLSIILVGVGYGSWEHMKKFQDKIPKRKFDNFQFVNFSEIYTTRDANPSTKEAAFALAALKQIPLQYKAALDIGIIGCTRGNAKKIVICSPPVQQTGHAPPSFEPSDLPLPATSVNELCLQEVTDALLKGLESSNLIVGIDCTKSNECKGTAPFNGQNLHVIGDTPNPYEEVITLVGKSFSPFQRDNPIHCFGFGDATTLDHEVFSFHGDHSPCYGFEEVLVCYRRIVRNVQLAGRTSYAPMIEAAVDMVEKSGGHYHVLVIIAAGQVTRSSCAGNMSLQEEQTIRSIADASSYPLFIILVGVGGGSWEDLKKLFAEKIPACSNFQFVNFSGIMSMPATTSQKEAAFAVEALIEASEHYKSAVQCGIVGRTTGKANKVSPRPPPLPSSHHAKPATPKPSDHSAPSENYRRQMECPVCLVKEKDMAFGCGHVLCEGCGTQLSNCPLCRKSVDIRIKLFTG